jgi:hypothetical protein
LRIWRVEENWIGAREKKMTRTFRNSDFIAIWASFLLTGCGLAESSVQLELVAKEDRRAVEKAIRAINDADNRGDLSGALDCHAEDVVLIPPNSGPVFGNG